MAYDVSEPVIVETRLSDGQRLVADVYRPSGAGKYPVLLMRQPYGRRIASTVVLAHPAWYASHGYVVMVQDVRGRGGSGGRFRVLADDVSDGAETLIAAANLAGGDGRVATYGFSYQGMTQYMGLAGALAKGGVQPAAMAVAMAAWNVRNDWAFEGGAFRMAGNQYWALQMGAENARIGGHHEAYHALRSAAALVGTGAKPSRLAALDAWPEFTHYHEWLADEPAYWAACSPDAALNGRPLTVPTLHIGGWLDILLEGTLAAHAAFQSAGAPTELRIGPWTHMPWSRRVGELDHGEEAGEGADAAILAFFETTLKGRPPASPPVALFDLGRRRFAHFQALPPTREWSLFLTSTGRAAPTVTDGALSPDPGPAASDRLVHDPWRPAPSQGCELGALGGYLWREAIDSRGDVAVYTSAPLETSLTLAGRLSAEISVVSDASSFDLAAILSVVSEDGRAVAFAGGFQRTTSGAPEGPVVVNLHQTCMTLAVGQRLRLSLQAAAWPAHMVNPGTGMKPEDADLAECRPITLTIRHGAANPSRLVLSVAFQ